MNYYTGRRSEGSGEIHIYIIRDGLLNIWEWDDRLSGGNTASKGRPEGSRNKKTIFQEVLEVDGEAIIEKIKGSPISPRVQAIAQVVGLAILLSVFLFATYQDVFVRLPFLNR